LNRPASRQSGRRRARRPDSIRRRPATSGIALSFALATQNVSCLCNQNQTRRCTSRLRDICTITLAPPLGGELYVPRLSLSLLVYIIASSIFHNSWPGEARRWTWPRARRRRSAASAALFTKSGAVHVRVSLSPAGASACAVACVCVSGREDRSRRRKIEHGAGYGALSLRLSCGYGRLNFNLNDSRLLTSHHPYLGLAC
jgi:hypothetical protein